MFFESGTGIVFDDPFDGDCSALSDAEIAGIGVVLSFVIAAAATTVASLTAAWLDACLLDEKAFLPKALQRRLNGGRDPSTMHGHRRWRSVLDSLILSLADQQLLTGLALMLAGYIKLSENLQQAHFYLIVYMCCLSSGSHLASIITLRKYLEEHTLTSKIRIGLVTLFAGSLITSIILSGAFGPLFIPVRWILLFTGIGVFPFANAIFGFVPIIWIFWTAILEVAPLVQDIVIEFVRNRIWRFCKRWLGLGILLKRLRHQPFIYVVEVILRKVVISVFWYILLSSPCTTFVLQVVFAAASTAMTLSQKFAKPGPDSDGICTLSSPDENSWGFGQILSVLLLWLPVYSTIETYIEHYDKEKKEKEEDADSTELVGTASSPATRAVPVIPSSTDALATADTGDMGTARILPLDESYSKHASRRGSHSSQTLSDNSPGRLMSRGRRVDTEMGGYAGITTTTATSTTTLPSTITDANNESPGTDTGVTTSSYLHQVHPVSRSDTARFMNITST